MNKPDRVHELTKEDVDAMADLQYQLDGLGVVAGKVQRQIQERMAELAKRFNVSEGSGVSINFQDQTLEVFSPHPNMLSIPKKRILPH
jgi:hypothetical protein